MFEVLKTFFSVLVKFFTVVLLMVAIAFVSFEGVMYYLTGNFYQYKKTAEVSEKKGQANAGETQTENKDSVNILFFYEDTENKDFDVKVNMINLKTGVVDVLLLPSNSQFSVSGTLEKELAGEGTVTDNKVTLQAVDRSFGEKKYEMMTEILSETLGLEFVGYDLMKQDQLTEFLEIAGKVSCNVPDTMSYRDSDNVLHTIPEGTQEMDSDTAIEYMRYLDGSASQYGARLERISSYYEAFSSQVLDKMSGKELYNKFISYAQINGERKSEIEEALEKITGDSVTIRALSGSTVDGIYQIDAQKARLQVSGLVAQAAAYTGKTNSSDTNNQTTNGEVRDSKDCDIELYNAGYISGLAGSWRDYLEERGYQISRLDNYDGALDQTQIVVTEDGMGQDLLEFYPNAEIVVEEISTGADIRIYLGTDSAYIIPGYEDVTQEENQTDETSSEDGVDQEDSSDQEETDFVSDDEEDAYE